MATETITARTQLDLRARHPEFQQYLDFNEVHSAKMRQQNDCSIDVCYGDAPLQTLDIFPSKVEHSPVLLFIHGGYWRGLDKSSYSFVAAPFVQNNFTVVNVNYRLLPMVSMTQLHQDIIQAVHWVQNNIQQYNGNAQALTISGHSAGGQLALAAYLFDESIRQSVSAICSLSGLFDLKPIQHSYLNDTLKLTDDDVERYSIINKDLSVLQCPTLLSVGGAETPLFVKQSQELFNRKAQHSKMQYLPLAELNHYQIAHELANASSPISQFILANQR